MATKAEVAAAQARAAQQAAQLAAAQQATRAAQAKLATFGNQETIDFTKKIAPRFTEMSAMAKKVATKAASKPDFKPQGFTLDEFKQKAESIQKTGTEYETKVAGITEAEQELATAQGLIAQYSTPVPIPTLTKTPNVAYDTIGKILENYRITDLASVLEDIRDEYPEASSEEVLTLLQFDPRYNAKFNERFAANQKRLKEGKPVLSPSEYLKLEQGYIKVLNAYNLPTFKTQKYYDTFIESDLDVEEVTDRIQLGYDRVLNDQAVQSAFNKFFSSLGFSDIVAGMLDPVNQLPALERKVKAAEIGGAALRQGLMTSELAATEAQANVPYTNVTRGTVGADVLGREGVTKAQAEAGYRNIAQLLPTAEKLSSIYGKTELQYGLLEAEQEQLQGLASAARKRQRLTELETAQFRKQSGLAKGALSSITNV